MKKSILVFFALIFYSTAYSYGLYQTGSGVGVYSSRPHVLLARSDIGRSVDIEVLFDKPFETTPHVALSTSMIDMEAGAPNGFSTELIFVNERGFKIRSEALSEKKIASLSYNWFATNDPRIHIEYVKTRDLGELSNDNVEGVREHSITVPIVNWSGKSPIATSFLVGVEFAENGHSLSFKQQITEVTDKNFKILMESSDGSASVKNAKFCVVLSSQEHSFNTGDLGLKVKKDHPWVARDSGDSYVPIEFEVPLDLGKGNRVHIQGITGFDVSGEVRVVVNDISEKDNIAQLSYGTWADSKLQEIGYQAFYFSADDMKIFDENCAEIFSKCNFEGQSMKVCDSMKKMEEFSYPIKSVHVPAGSTISLYSQQGFRGQKVKFTESVECLDMNAILVGEEDEEGVDLYDSEEGVEYSENTSEEGINFGEDSESDGWLSESGEDSFGFGEGEDASLYQSNDESSSYDISSGEDAVDVAEKMHLFLGEGESVSYEESDDGISFSEESTSINYSSSEESDGYSYDYSSEENSEGASSYSSNTSEDSGYDVESEEGVSVSEEFQQVDQ